MRRIPPWLVTLFGFSLVAHLTIWLEANLASQTLATLTITGVIPGWLLVHLLFWQTIRASERILYTIASGYAVMVIGMLLLSYLPGGVARWQVLLLFDGLFLLLALGATLRAMTKRSDKSANAFTPIRRPSKLLLLAAILLLLIAGFLRFTNIGYAEFHNDEARAALRAAAVIQGSEDVLLIHKKGPTEILIPTAVYALAGNFNETAGRLLFAIANLTGLFGVWLLGWQLFGRGKQGHVVGFSAALLLALDGYFIGFSRIVQYQSVVFMTTVLTVAIFARLWRDSSNAMGHMVLAAILMVLGLLSHYEAGLAMLPVFVLLVGMLWGTELRKQNAATTLDDEVVHASHTPALSLPNGSHYWVTIAVATVVGIALLALFYIPFLTHPQFSATYTYLAERRIGGTGLPYNNLADVFLRTTVYSTTYYVGLLIAVTLLGLVVALRRGMGKRLTRILTPVLSAILLLFLFDPTWLTIGGRDWAIVPFLLAFGLVWLMPKMNLGERTLWIWFGSLFLLAIFGTLKPRTHVYVFIIPWALLVGWILAQLWQRLNRAHLRTNREDDRTVSPIARFFRAGQWGNSENSALKGRVTIVSMAGIFAISMIALAFGNYAYRYFVQNQPEVLRTWSENRPAGYWTTYDEPDKRALFGFPSSNGWKVIGQLYAQGEIEGNFETNELEAWGPAWYTRGQVRCQHDADWYFQTVSNLEPFYDFQRIAMEDYLSKGFAPWGEVTVNGVHKMTIHKHSGSDEEQPADPLPVFELNDFQTAFDQNTTPDLPLTYPVVNPPIPNPLHVNLSNLFWLEGYDIDHPRPLRTGDTIRLTLFWRGQQPTDKTYKIFNQSYYGEGTMVAQKDGHPVCGNRDTWQWDPGELITDVHEIPVKEDAPDGLYPFITGMYELDSGVRLEVIDKDGNVIGDQIHLTDIRVGVE